MHSILLFFLIFLPFLLSQTPKEDLIDAAKIFPQYTFSFKLYGGYLNLTSTKAFHYLFLESQKNPTTDPLIVWLNGGPGCSSLLGAFYENGPFLFKTDSDGFQDAMNKHAWNNYANVLYLESPGGVGFSTASDDEINKLSNDYQTSQDNLNALIIWLKRFPSYQSNDLYISGESYGGIYVPFFAYAIHNYTLNLTGKVEINIKLKGWAVGNACTSPDECVSSKILFKNQSSSYAYDFYWQQGKYSPELRKDYENTCLKNPSSADCADIQGRIIKQIDNDKLNVYDLYQPCYEQGLPGVPPCTDCVAAFKFFNNDTVKDILHANKNIKWNMCSDQVGNSYIKSLEASYWIYKTLIPLQKYKILVFSGDTDAAVPITGTRAWIDRLRKEINMPKLSPWRPWSYPGKKNNEPQVAGFVEQYLGFTFVTVRGVGHMVPQWGPSQAEVLIRTYLNGDAWPGLNN